MPVSVGPFARPSLEDRTPIRFAQLVGREGDGVTPPPDYEEG